jgi:hypothetical protein
MDPDLYFGSINLVLCLFLEVDEVSSCIIFAYGFALLRATNAFTGCHSPFHATTAFTIFTSPTLYHPGRPHPTTTISLFLVLLVSRPPSTINISMQTNTTMQPLFRSFKEDPHFLYHLKAAGNLPPLPIPRGAPDPRTRSRLIAHSKMFFEAELFPRLPAEWIDYCMRVQMAYDRINWVLESRSQGGWGTVYYGECITIERGLGILNQFVGHPSTAQFPLPGGS